MTSYERIMVDYHLNIQAKSTSGAPFNLWPYQLKFCLMRPILIYQSIISTISDSIVTNVFPGRDEGKMHNVEALYMYSRSKNLTMQKIRLLAELVGLTERLPATSKRDSLFYIENHISESNIPRSVVADKLAAALYWDDIKGHIVTLQEPLEWRITALSMTK